MRDLDNETRKALKDGRVEIFVHLDLIGKSMRVTSSENTINWDGSAWEGLGGVLKHRTEFIPLSLGVNESTEGCVSFSVPLNNIRESFSMAHYLNRTVEFNICAVNEDVSEVVGRVVYFKGKVVSEKDVRVEDGIVTFTARDDVLTERKLKNERLRVAKETHKSISNMNMKGMSSTFTSVFDLILILFGVGSLGLGICSMPFDVRKMITVIKQRRLGAKEKFWINTQPSIPLKWKQRRKGYLIRAETGEEAKEIVEQIICRRIWLFRPQILRIIIGGLDYPMIINLDDFRRLNPTLWSEFREKHRKIGDFYIDEIG